MQHREVKVQGHREWPWKVTSAVWTYLIPRKFSKY